MGFRSYTDSIIGDLLLAAGDSAPFPSAEGKRPVSLIARCPDRLPLRGRFVCPLRFQRLARRAWDHLSCSTMRRPASPQKKSPRQPTRAESHDVEHQMNLTVIGADGALIEQRRQSGGRRLAEP